MQKDETERNPLYQEANLESTIDNIYPDSIDVEFNNLLLRAHANTMASIIGMTMNFTIHFMEVILEMKPLSLR